MSITLNNAHHLQHNMHFVVQDRTQLSYTLASSACYVLHTTHTKYHHHSLARWHFPPLLH